MDGNFSAQHLASRVPENNVNFTDGLGYFAKSNDYANYLKHSKDDLVSEILHFSFCFMLMKCRTTGRPWNVTLTGQQVTQESPGIPSMTSRASHRVHVQDMDSFLPEVQQIYKKEKGGSAQLLR
jgi:hypothetical protein